MWGFPGGDFRVRIMSPCNLGYESYSQKTRVPGLPVGENGIILSSFVLMQHQRVMDGRTDGHAAYTRAPSRIVFQLRLAEQYFRLIFGSAGFTRTGENVAELRLVAQFAAKIRLKQ